MITNERHLCGASVGGREQPRYPGAAHLVFGAVGLRELDTTSSFYGAVHATCGLTGWIADETDDPVSDDDVDPERLAVCAYWRCGVLFERRSANQRFCRKACRSRQAKWERAQQRRATRDETKRLRRRT